MISKAESRNKKRGGDDSPLGVWKGYLKMGYFLSDAFVTRNAFPREVLLEAILRFVEESLLAESSR